MEGHIIEHQGNRARRPPAVTHNRQAFRFQKLTHRKSGLCCIIGQKSDQ